MFRSLSAVLLLLALAAAPTRLHAQQPPMPAAEAAAIDTTLAVFGDTLRDMDFQKFATVWTEDADFVNIVGMHWHGKSEIVQAHSVVFTTRYKHVPQTIVEKSEALLSPSIALVVTKIHLDDYTAQDGKLMTNNFFRMTLVLEKQNGRWLIRAAENTPIDLEAAKHDPAHPAQ